MKHESQHHTTGDKCPRNNTIKSRNWFKETGIETKITEFQKTVLPLTAQILQKVLEI